jgi:hypothetical protein
MKIRERQKQPWFTALSSPKFTKHFGDIVAFYKTQRFGVATTNTAVSSYTEPDEK